MWNIKIICLVFFHLALGSLFAQNDSTATPKVLKSKILLGFNQSKGNVNRFSSNSELELSLIYPKHQWMLDIRHQNFYNNGTKLDETIELSIFTLYNLNDKDHLYAKASIYRNEFRGFALQWKEGVGYLRDWVRNTNFQFNSRLGYQMRQNKIVSGVVDDFQAGNHHFGQFGSRVKGTIMKNISASFQIDYEFDFVSARNFYFDILTSIDLKVNHLVGVQFKYQYWYAGIPITGLEPMDQSIRSSLTFNF